MFGPFSIFATENNLPLSGNVDQEIVLGAISNQIAGLPEVEREIDGEVKTHTMIRADVCSNQDEAVRVSVLKAKMLIDQQGEGIFR